MSAVSTQDSVTNRNYRHFYINIVLVMDYFEISNTHHYFEIGVVTRLAIGSLFDV